MRRHNDLQFAGGALMAFVRLAGLLRLLIKKTEHRSLKLRMKVRLRLFDKEERQIRVVHLLQFDSDRRHVEKVRVPMSRVTQVLRLDAMIGELEPQVARYIDQFLVVGKANRGRLATDAGSQRTETDLDCPTHLTEDLGAASAPRRRDFASSSGAFPSKKWFSSA